MDTQTSKQRYLLLILTMMLTGASVGFGQKVNIGVPPIWNYSRKAYGAATQNWDAAQDKSKQIYFANNDGLLRFNGSSWKTFKVSNNTIVRSIGISEDNRIYTGAQSDIGYFFPGPDGVLKYTSLIGMLPPDHRSFEDVWDIAFHNGHVFFRTNRSVFQYTGKEIHIHSDGSEFLSMFSSPRGLLLQKADHKIYVFQKWRIFCTR